MNKEDTALKEGVFAEASSLFFRVRDIPFVAGIDGNPHKLFNERQGNCTRKHLYLVPKLQALGYRVGLGIAEFSWQDLSIPSEILQLLKDPIDTHLFLYVSQGQEELVVDATWDTAMPEQFHINTWDGQNTMLLGVPAKKISRINYQLLTARAMISSAAKSVGINRQNDYPSPFNHAFNQWLGRDQF